MITFVGGKTRTDAQGEVPKGWDHDPPAKAKSVPYGILMVATGALMLVFGSRETSDAWVDVLMMWWRQVRRAHRRIERLVIYLDNGPKNSGRRTQFLKRMVQFADWSGLAIRLVYYPPYHSKYNPIQRCWSTLEQKWNGELLNCLEVVLRCARRMTWRGRQRSRQFPGFAEPTQNMRRASSCVLINIPSKCFEVFTIRWISIDFTSEYCFPLQCCLLAIHGI